MDVIGSVIMDQIGHMADIPVFADGKVGVLVCFCKRYSRIRVIKGEGTVFTEQNRTVIGDMDGRCGGDGTRILRSASEGDIQRTAV